MSESSPHEPAPNVLVVDDDDGVRRVLGQWVERLGYRVLSAASADRALELLDQEPVAVALCDIRMPGRDGIWLADRIRERYPSVGVALVTGLHEMDVAFTLRPGIVGYVTKPFNRDAISGAIRLALEWHQGPSHGPPSVEALMDAITSWDAL